VTRSVLVRVRGEIARGARRWVGEEVGDDRSAEVEVADDRVEVGEERVESDHHRSQLAEEAAQ
jgi:hypothetical protein